MKDNSINKLNYDDVVQFVNVCEGNSKDMRPVKVAILRNITIEPIIPYIKYFCFRAGLKADIYIGGYDNVMQEILNADSALFRFKPDIVVLCLKMDILSEKLQKRFTEMGSNEIKNEVERTVDYIRQAIHGIRKKNNVMVLVHNYETPVFPSFGILDYQDRAKQINTFRTINLNLVDLIHQYQNVYIVDIDLLQSIIGYNNFIDKRYWHIGKAPYSREALETIANEYTKFIKAKNGKNHKCLVLDCDNTLWGGIIGEDGIDKIKIGKTYPGSAYLEFQQAILNLYHRGVILAICSKNNKEDVLDVLENHDGMLLREKHFAKYKINWADKVTNINEIAKELNIGLDSMVFIDDSQYETDMVKKYLPMVEVINLPKDPTGYRDLLSSSGLFDSLAFSAEDRKRNQLYKDESRRKEMIPQFSNLDDYFKYLEMEVIICSTDKSSIDRVVQLIKRTNQFNMTTKRYAESDIINFINSDEYEVIHLRLKDRFGDMGIVGVAILNSAGDDFLIDTFLLSCRVIGRGVEDVFLSKCLEIAIKKGKRKVSGIYIKTNKNEVVSDFYRRSGFDLEYEKGKELVFHILLNNQSPLHQKYFKSVETKYSVNSRKEAVG